MIVMTENQPNTKKLPPANRTPSIFLSFNDRMAPKPARMAINKKIMTVPIFFPLCSVFQPITCYYEKDHAQEKIVIPF